MADDWGLLENWDEPMEDEIPDTWWCAVCNSFVAMFVAEGAPLPTHCPQCGTAFPPPEPILPAYIP